MSGRHRRVIGDASAGRHADGFLVNSRATRHDLLRIAEQLGCTIAEDKIEVVPLDADFGRSASPGPAVDLSKWNLAGTSFALMVSTVEPRKNHILAFDAWAELIRIHGADAIPLLVCAGRKIGRASRGESAWRYV